MKWPEYLVLVRHAKSAYNALREKKKADPEYQEFQRLFETDPDSAECMQLARRIADRFALGISDADTPVLDGEDSEAAVRVGAALKTRLGEVPHIIYLSPYQRTRRTLELMQEGWPELAEVKTVQDERLREQEHGLLTMYNDYRVFNALNPEQRRYYDQCGQYRYRYPQGENVPDVRERIRSWLQTIVREHTGERVLAVTHHLAILSLRANLERLLEPEFLALDGYPNKPINCGVTTYIGNPNQGRQGRLVLRDYNERLY